METVGEFFKQARETKGLTLDEVASKTRIHPSFLRAIEEGNFTKLPDQVFVKGFVRSYARSLGIDEDDAVRRFMATAGSFYEKQEEGERLRLKQAEDERRKRTNRNVVVIGAGVVLLGLVFVISREQTAVTIRHPEPQPDRPVPSMEERVPAPAPETELPAATATSPSPEARAAAEPRHEETASPTQETAPVPALPLEDVPDHGPLTLDVEATELSWVVVQVDGAGLHEALLRPGERVRWTASERFNLTLGNAGGVRLELNGKPVGPFGDSGKVARDIVLRR
jgi:cytoskeletal protein RodZ